MCTGVRVQVRGRSDEGLPRIIGGSDLVAHERSNYSKELEEWLREQQEVRALV